LGILKAGKIQVPLESSFPRARLSYMLEQSHAVMALTDTANLAFAQELTTLPLINVDEIDADTPAANPGLSLHPERMVAIDYTSGSTGKPKGIVRTHGGVLHDVMNYTNTFHICPHDRLVIFRAGTIEHFYALLNGAAAFPVDLRTMEPSAVAGWMRQENITVFRAAVSAFRALVAALTGNAAFPYLRLICVYGEATFEKDVQLYRRHFSDQCLLVSSLGTSEFGDYAYFFVDKTTKLPGGVVPGGFPIATTHIVLLDEADRPVARGDIGEIAVQSHYGAAGYWRRPELTNAAFIVDVHDDNMRTFKTGDVGRVGADGCIFHLGRKDFQVKIRGHRVEVLEVETILLECEEIKEVAVVGHTDTHGSTQLVAYLMAAHKNKPAVSELRQMLANQLPDFMVPAFFVWLETFPRTATGKVDRRALPVPDKTRPVLATPFVAARMPVEENLAAIWAEVLGLDRIGIHDRFLELGGDSLLATQLISRVLAAFRVRLALKTLWEAPTVAEMAEAIVHCQAEQLDEQELNQILAELETPFNT
jgi:acyl-coenzyme A synthetase/AMP-(fatty) acid ligase/acyl carrier protein